MKVFPHPRRFLGNAKHLAGRPTILRPDSQPPVFGKEQALSVIQKLAKLEESHASLQTFDSVLQRKVAELEPTQLAQR